jgi:SAM-dependent methyltransferase
MDRAYDADLVRQHYDDVGEQEWYRLERSPRGRVSFHIHRFCLQRYVRSGDEVLEVGAGPGRFTIELARLGARVTVGDISRKQLSLNAEKVREADYESSVVARDVMDIVDLSRFPSRAFDCVVCYGGPLSYVFDHTDDALSELLRVTRPGGHVLLSVMSLLGAVRAFVSGVRSEVESFGLEEFEAILNTGDQRGPIAHGHPCHMYRWDELRALLGRHPCEIVDASAANFLSVENGEALSGIEADPALWERFLAWELQFCREPGALDAGTHIIAVVRRTVDGDRGGSVESSRHE